MGVDLGVQPWEPPLLLYIVFFAGCSFFLLVLPQFGSYSQSKYSFNTDSSSFYRFRRKFLLVYSVGSLVGGFQSTVGEFEFNQYKLSKERIMMILFRGYMVSVLSISFIGAIFDARGHHQACAIYFFLQIFVGFLKGTAGPVSSSLSNTCAIIASSISSISFESWLVIEHRNLNFSRDLLMNTFWLMSVVKCASLIGSQALGNLLLHRGADKRTTYQLPLSFSLSFLCLIHIMRNWSYILPVPNFRDYITALSNNIFKDKRIFLLVWAQAWLHFSMEVFWLLWAPTIVSDGREVHLSMIYPCLLGSQMLGSIAVPWILDGLFCIMVEDLLSIAFCISSLATFIVAYDYQEVGLLVALFCVYHACAGVISPLLALLRTSLVPDELRGGMMSMSFIPANAALLFVIAFRKCCQSPNNSFVLAFASFGLLMSAVFIHTLKSWKKKHEDWHKL